MHSSCSLWLICHLDFRPEEYLDKNLNTTTKETEYRERRLEILIPGHSKRLEMWIYSSVALRIFAFESKDNCSWP